MTRSIETASCTEEGEGAIYCHVVGRTISTGDDDDADDGGH